MLVIRSHGLNLCQSFIQVAELFFCLWTAVIWSGLLQMYSLLTAAQWRIRARPPSACGYLQSDCIDYWILTVWNMKLSHLIIRSSCRPMTDVTGKQLNCRKYTCRYRIRGVQRKTTHTPKMYKKLFTKAFMNIEWLSALNIVRTKLFPWIHRNTFRIWLQESKTCIKKPFEVSSVCIIPCKISYCLSVLMCIQRRDWILS